MTIKFTVILIFFFIRANCVNSLPPITGLKLTYLTPIGIYAQWDIPYESIHHITGYKVKLWSVEEKTTRNYKLLNGDQYPGLERNDNAEEPFNKEYTPKREVSNITRINPYHNEARFLNIVVETLYEVRVCSYKGEEIGPMTDPVRVKFLKSKPDYTMSEKVVKPRPKYMVLAQRRLDSCGVSIITNSSDGEPYIHNTYL